MTISMEKMLRSSRLVAIFYFTLPIVLAIVLYSFYTSKQVSIMGLPASSNPVNDVPSNPVQPSAMPADQPATPAQSSSAPQSAAQLPPEALDLAQKLFDFARNGDTASLRQYLAAGIPPNLTNHSGDTLLMLAAYHGHAETVKELLAMGADPNSINGRGQSPLAGAVFKGYDDVVKTLYDGGADIRAGQPTAADCARMFKREEIIKLFGINEAEEGPLPGMPGPANMAPGGSGAAGAA